MKIEEIGIWEAFQGVAKHGNFSKASKALKIGVPQVSKRIAKLEENLGVRLFQRSTRVVSLTEDGHALLPKVSAMLEDLAGIEASFEEGRELSGTIRITSVPYLAHRLLIPVIQRFRNQHPRVDLELNLSGTLVNLVESNVDLAIRICDEIEDSSLIYRKLAPNPLIFCASPGYLKANKTPLKTITDLKNHELLMLTAHGECGIKGRPQKLESLVRPRKIVAENAWYLTQLGLADFGVLIRPIWDVKEYLDSGALVQVLKKETLENFEDIYAVLPSRRFLAPRVRMFLDYVVQEAATWK